MLFCCLPLFGTYFECISMTFDHQGDLVMNTYTQGTRPVIDHNTIELREHVRRLRREMTTAERILWGELRANRLDGFHFRRQSPICGFVVDFYCHQARLVIEVDGIGHDDQKEYDAQRDRFISSQGLRMLRFSNANVLTNLNAVIGTIRKAL